MKRPGEGIPELFRGYHCLDVLTRYRGEDLGGVVRDERRTLA